MSEIAGVGDLHGMEGILPGTTHGITVRGPIIHGTARLGVGVAFIVHGITVHGMAHPGDGAEVIGEVTEVIMADITAITPEAIMEVVTIIHRLTRIHLTDVQQLAVM